MISKSIPQISPDPLETQQVNKSCDYSYKRRKAQKLSRDCWVSNGPQATRTLRSTLNISTITCQICCQPYESIQDKLCKCNDRFIHQKCLLQSLLENYKFGTGILQCSNCGVFYPTQVTIDRNFGKLKTLQKIQYGLQFFILLTMILIEIILMVTLETSTTVSIIIAILGVIELVCIITLGMQLWRNLIFVKFRIEKYSSKSNNSENLRNAKLIITALQLKQYTVQETDLEFLT